MEIAEPIESINSQLRDLFGIDTISALPIWQVVWSDDQFEKRLTDYSETGLFMLTPRIIEFPKYRQWVNPPKFVLEQLVIVPDTSRKELAFAKTSYEPLWVFQDDFGKPLPPRMDVIKFIVDSVNAVKGKESLAKYKDPAADGENGLEVRKAEIEKLQNEMFGDESGLGGAIVYGHGVSMTGPRKEN